MGKLEMGGAVIRICVEGFGEWGVCGCDDLIEDEGVSAIDFLLWSRPAMVVSLTWQGLWYTGLHAAFIVARDTSY